jgi:molybdopterin-biosynthesis enzyme MoeA-like protein
LDRGIEYDPATREKIENVYRNRGDRDTVRGLRMARILEGSRALLNTVGFSVGMMLEVRGRLIFTLPGVPEEMREMFNRELVPIIERRSNIRFYPKTVRVRMVWKDFFPLFREIQRECPDVYLKNVATPPVEEDDRHKVHDIIVYIVVKGDSLGEAKNRMKDFLEEYERRIIQAGGGEIIPS